MEVLAKAYHLFGAEPSGVYYDYKGLLVADGLLESLAATVPCIFSGIHEHGKVALVIQQGIKALVLGKVYTHDYFASGKTD